MPQQKQPSDSGPAAQAQPDPRVQLLLTLITLHKNARHKKKRSELEFLIVNQTFNLVQYRHCVYWRWNGESVSLDAASGLVQLDTHGPYTIWLQKFIGYILEDKGVLKKPADLEEESFVSMVPLTVADCHGPDTDDWKKWASANALMFNMRNHEGKVAYGIWIDREEAFTDTEKAFLEDLSDGYAHSMHHFESSRSEEKKTAFWKSVFRLSRSKVMWAFLAISLAMLCPVRMSVTAPAEVVARSPYVVSVPFDGVIKDVDVVPNQLVKKGDLLVRMDSTVLKNKSEMTLREMEIAEIAFSKTEREALQDRSKLAEIGILKSQVEAKNSERAFAVELLSRSEIRAERDGVVIFADINSLRGKPVNTGEQIMLLADPKDSELLIRVPVDAMIQIDQSMPATFFLNVSPLAFSDATYESIGYQATPDPDGLLTYKVRAKFNSEKENPRVGWTGTGKVYGQKTILVFNILRRPLVTLRHKLGI